MNKDQPPVPQLIGVGDPLPENEARAFPRGRSAAVAGVSGGLVVLGLAAYLLTGGGSEGTSAPKSVSAMRGPIMPIRLTDKAARADALRALDVQSTELSEIAAAVDSGKLQLGRLTLWDWADGDGDVVTVTSAGYLQRIQLSKTPLTLVIPFTQPGELTLMGLIDGGGGITVATNYGGQALKLKAIAPGETIALTIP